jgi:hypothetical protein
MRYQIFFDIEQIVVPTAIETDDIEKNSKRIDRRDK